MTASLPDWNQLGRYLAGELPPEEAAAVRRLLQERPADAEVLAALDEATKRRTSQAAVDVESALRAVKERQRVATSSVRWRYAAAALVLLTAGVFGWQRIRPNTSVPNATLTYATSVGKPEIVRLEDGSSLIIGPSSVVIVNGREIDVSGDAYFRIRHDDARPYVVRASGTVIRDIGTEFSVQALVGQPLRVVVVSGAVEMERETGGVQTRLDSGDVGVVELNGRITLGRGSASADDVAWTEGRLVFRNASLPQVAADLRRWYGVELLVSDSSLLRRHFTGSFVNEPRQRVLEVIALALGARLESRGDTAYFRLPGPPR